MSPFLPLLAIAFAAQPALASVEAPIPPAAVAREIEQRLAGSGPLLVGGLALDRGSLRAALGSGPYPALSAEAVARLAATAAEDGLDPADYHPGALAPAPGSVAATAERDLLALDALLRLAHDLRRGRAAPEPTQGAGRPIAPDSFDAGAFIAAVATGDLDDALAEQRPPYWGYAELREALGRYRAIAAAGGWAEIPPGRLVRPDEADLRIPALRRRLADEGDYAGDDFMSPILDGDLAAALRRFQARHGLASDAALGGATLAALNLPVERRIEQIAVNLERWRWMPRDIEPEHVAVNLASARLELVRDGMAVMSMPVIVGAPRHATPVFRSTVTGIVLNPPWFVPRSIAAEEILPQLQNDPAYLVSNDMRIIDAFSADDPAAYGDGIDWHGYSAADFPFRLRQEPGPRNALGRIKFDVANSNSIFLHDTPDRDLFRRPQRALSHGCVRLAEPLQLAAALLADKWPHERIEAALDDGRTVRVGLSRPMPLYLLYWTAWIGPEGEVQFRDDVYGLDARLAAALARPGPTRPLASAGMPPLTD